MLVCAGDVRGRRTARSFVDRASGESETLLTTKRLACATRSGDAFAAAAAVAARGGMMNCVETLVPRSASRFDDGCVQATGVENLSKVFRVHSGP